jgi:hypothetical protein
MDQIRTLCDADNPITLSPMESARDDGEQQTRNKAKLENTSSENKKTTQKTVKEKKQAQRESNRNVKKSTVGLKRSFMENVPDFMKRNKKINMGDQLTLN